VDPEPRRFCWACYVFQRCCGRRTIEAGKHGGRGGLRLPALPRCVPYSRNTSLPKWPLFPSYFRRGLFGWYETLFLVLFACALLAGLPEISRVRFSAAARMTLYALFGLSLLTSANFHQAERDLRGPARAWHERQSRPAWLKGRCNTIGPITSQACPVQESGLSGIRGCWVNQGMAVYSSCGRSFPQRS